MQVRFPSKADMSRRLRAAQLGSYEPAVTICLGRSVADRSMPAEGALVCIGAALLAAAKIELIAPTPSTGPVTDSAARMRMVVEALFDGIERDAVMEKMAASEGEA